MADTKTHLFARDARDRLIDHLGLGETYPLRDLPLAAQRLVVPEGLAAGVPIEASQRDCTYSLWTRQDEVEVTREEGGVAVPAAAAGTGGTIRLETPPIDRDLSYRIRATRQSTSRWVYLHALAEIKIGLDTQLDARVVSGAPLLPSPEGPADTNPRVVDHGAEVEVEIDHSQPGVDYHLVRLVSGAAQVISQAPARGNLQTVTLRSNALTEDALLQILATRTLGAPGQETTQQGLLDVALPVVVRPDTERGVSVEGSHIVDHLGSAIIAVSGSQLGVRYQLHARRIGRADFLAGGAPDPASVEVAGEGGRAFTIARPAHTPAWVDPPGFAALGETAAGDGGTLRLTAGPLTDDCVILVRAVKEITLSDGRQVAVAAPLRLAAALLTRPDPAPGLSFEVLMSGDLTRGALRILGGQRGVFYQLRLGPGGEDLGRPAYFHERQGEAPEVNVGVGALRIGQDLAIGRDPWTDLAAPDLAGIEAAAVEEELAISGRPAEIAPAGAQELATRPPGPPIVRTGLLAVGTILQGHAVKARTALSAPLAHSAEITPAGVSWIGA